MDEPIWIIKDVAIAIHYRQLAEHGGSEGIRDEGLLKSALCRPRNQFAYGNPSIFTLAAAYGYGIVNNHPFVDGNKRTSYVVSLTFLLLNSYVIQASPVEKYQTWIKLASSQLSEAELADWFEKNSQNRT
ncbi:MAG: type II toxin-antitoxin system death-on-curing family toxin [Cyanobacteria bacterium J083]|nr:MAG: type II toxin-antitoxin system death-on-curing family toxin [Cyanobacteria bacterium J083]